MGDLVILLAADLAQYRAPLPLAWTSRHLRGPCLDSKVRPYHKSGILGIGIHNDHPEAGHGAISQGRAERHLQQQLALVCRKAQFVAKARCRDNITPSTNSMIPILRCASLTRPLMLQAGKLQSLASEAPRTRRTDLELSRFLSYSNFPRLCQVACGTTGVLPTVPVGSLHAEESVVKQCKQTC